MQIATLDEIVHRANRLRLTPNSLGRLADVHPTSIRSIRAEGSTVRTLRKLLGALVKEEVGMRDYLNALHPPGVPAPSANGDLAALLDDEARMT